MIFVVSVPNHRQHLFPFVLSLSKYERTLQVMNGFSNLDSLFEWFFNPHPSTGFLRQAQGRANGLERRFPETTRD
ncbi:MAG: hypothetical protein LBD67_08020 [Candidatus Accumulibacter sp.]|nr:hypothetical protein [Accumulibacter sp.]